MTPGREKMEVEGLQERFLHTCLDNLGNGCGFVGGIQLAFESIFVRTLADIRQYADRYSKKKLLALRAH